MSGQAAGLAVGAAVGSILLPGIGTALGGSIGAGTGALAGAGIGVGLAGAGESLSLSNSQRKIDTAALLLNQSLFHAKAASQSAIHAANFRQSLAHQVSIASMRGGSGSLVSQFGNQAYKNFIEDQKAIEQGVKVADVQTELGKADITARSMAGQVSAVGRAISAFDGLNLNLPRQRT